MLLFGVSQFWTKVSSVKLKAKRVILLVFGPYRLRQVQLRHGNHLLVRTAYELLVYIS